MPKFFARIVALILVPCLVIDPITVMGSVGAGHCPRPQSEFQSIQLTQISGRHGGLPLQLFASQAFALRAGTSGRPPSGTSTAILDHTAAGLLPPTRQGVGPVYPEEDRFAALHAYARWDKAFLAASRCTLPEEAKAEVQEALVEWRCRGGQWEDALKIAREIPEGHYLLAIALARVLPVQVEKAGEHAASSTLEEVLAIARGLKDLDLRAQALAFIARQMDASEGSFSLAAHDKFQEALGVARSIPETDLALRAETLVFIAAELALVGGEHKAEREAETRRIFDEAIRIVSSIPDNPQAQDRVRAAVAARRAEAGFIEDAEKTLDRIQDPFCRVLAGAVIGREKAKQLRYPGSVPIYFKSVEKDLTSVDPSNQDQALLVFAGELARAGYFGEARRKAAGIKSPFLKAETMATIVRERARSDRTVPESREEIAKQSPELEAAFQARAEIGLNLALPELAHRFDAQIVEYYEKGVLSLEQRKQYFSALASCRPSCVGLLPGGYGSVKISVLGQEEGDSKPMFQGSRMVRLKPDEAHFSSSLGVSKVVSLEYLDSLPAGALDFVRFSVLADGCKGRRFTEFGRGFTWIGLSIGGGLDMFRDDKTGLLFTLSMEKGAKIGLDAAIAEGVSTTHRKAIRLTVAPALERLELRNTPESLSVQVKGRVKIGVAMPPEPPGGKVLVGTPLQTLFKTYLPSALQTGVRINGVYFPPQFLEDQRVLPGDVYTLQGKPTIKTPRLPPPDQPSQPNAIVSVGPAAPPALEFGRGRGRKRSRGKTSTNQPFLDFRPPASAAPLKPMRTAKDAYWVNYSAVLADQEMWGVSLNLDGQPHLIEAHTEQERFQNMAYDAIQALKDRPRGELVKSIVGELLSKSPSILLQVTDRLPVNSARAGISGRDAVIVLQTKFVHTLLLLAKKHPQIAAWLLAERLYHELGHEGTTGVAEAELKEEARQIYYDALLQIDCVRHSNLRNEIHETFMHRDDIQFGSGYYFGKNKLLDRVIGLIEHGEHARQVVNNIEQELKSLYENSPFPNSARVSKHPKGWIGLKYMPTRPEDEPLADAASLAKPAAQPQDVLMRESPKQVMLDAQAKALITAWGSLYRPRDTRQARTRLSGSDLQRKQQQIRRQETEKTSPEELAELATRYGEFIAQLEAALDQADRAPTVDDEIAALMNITIAVLGQWQTREGMQNFDALAEALRRAREFQSEPNNFVTMTTREMDHVLDHASGVFKYFVARLIYGVTLWRYRKVKVTQNDSTKPTAALADEASPGSPVKGSESNPNVESGLLRTIISFGRVGARISGITAATWVALELFLFLFVLTSVLPVYWTATNAFHLGTFSHHHPYLYALSRIGISSLLAAVAHRHRIEKDPDSHEGFKIIGPADGMDKLKIFGLEVFYRVGFLVVPFITEEVAMWAAVVLQVLYDFFFARDPWIRSMLKPTPGTPAAPVTRAKSSRDPLESLLTMMRDYYQAFPDHDSQHDSTLAINLRKRIVNAARNGLRKKSFELGPAGRADDLVLETLFYRPTKAGEPAQVALYLGTHYTDTGGGGDIYDFLLITKEGARVQGTGDPREPEIEALCGKRITPGSSITPVEVLPSNPPATPAGALNPTMMEGAGEIARMNPDDELRDKLDVDFDRRSNPLPEAPRLQARVDAGHSVLFVDMQEAGLPESDRAAVQVIVIPAGDHWEMTLSIINRPSPDRYLLTLLPQIRRLVEPLDDPRVVFKDFSTEVYDRASLTRAVAQQLDQALKDSGFVEYDPKTFSPISREILWSQILSRDAFKPVALQLLAELGFSGKSADKLRLINSWWGFLSADHILPVVVAPAGPAATAGAKGATHAEALRALEHGIETELDVYLRQHLSDIPENRPAFTFENLRHLNVEFFKLDPMERIAWSHEFWTICRPLAQQWLMDQQRGAPISVGTPDDSPSSTGKPRGIVVPSLAIAVDFILQIEPANPEEPDGRLRIASGNMAPGGVPSQVNKMLHRWAQYDRLTPPNFTSVGVIGSDPVGHMLGALYDLFGLDRRLWVASEETSFFLHLLGKHQGKGFEARFTPQPAPLSAPQRAEFLKAAAEACRSHHGGILLANARMPVGDGALFQDLYRAGRDNDMEIVYIAKPDVMRDPGLRDAALTGIDTLSANLQEFSLALAGAYHGGHAPAELFPSGPDDYDFLVIQARRLIGSYGLKSILISLEDKGVILVDNETRVFRAPALKADLVDPIGAGDSATATAIYYLTAGQTKLVQLPDRFILDFLRRFVSAGAETVKVAGDLARPEQVIAALPDADAAASGDYALRSQVPEMFAKLREWWDSNPASQRLWEASPTPGAPTELIAYMSKLVDDCGKFVQSLAKVELAVDWESVISILDEATHQATEMAVLCELVLTSPGLHLPDDFAQLFRSIPEQAYVALQGLLDWVVHNVQPPAGRALKQAS